MLRACTRVLKPGAPVAFFAVALADGLSAADRSRAVGAGPDFVDAEPGYPALMQSAGYADVALEDLSNVYAATLADEIRVRDAESVTLRDLVGADQFAEGQALRRRELAAIHDGLLRRVLITAVRP